jgi:hypothetical protein
VNALKHRIAGQHKAQPDLRPAGRGQIFGAPLASPVSRIQIEPGVGVGLSPLSYLIAADGAPIPATGPGRWDQLVAAGRTA